MAFQVLHLLLSFIFSDQYFWFSLFDTFVLSRFKQPNVLSSQILCRHDDDEYLIPRKDDRIKFCHQQQVCQNLYIQWWKHTRGETLKNTREESNSTLNDANNKHEQLTMPVRSHRYCQNYNLNHFLSNKRIWIRYHLCWSLFHVVQPHALEKQSQLWKRICQKVNF